MGKIAPSGRSALNAIRVCVSTFIENNTLAVLDHNIVTLRFSSCFFSAPRVVLFDGTPSADSSVECNINQIRKNCELTANLCYGSETNSD